MKLLIEKEATKQVSDMELREIFERPLGATKLSILDKILTYLRPVDVVNLAGINQLVRKTMLAKCKSLPNMQLDLLQFPLYLDVNTIRLAFDLFPHTEHLRITTQSIDGNHKDDLLKLLEPLKSLLSIHVLISTDDSTKSLKQANLPISQLKIKCDGDFADGCDDDDGRICSCLASAPNLRRFSLTNGRLSVASIAELQTKTLERISLTNVWFEQEDVEPMLELLQQSNLKQLKLLLVEWNDACAIGQLRSLTRSFLESASKSNLEEFTFSISHCPVTHIFSNFKRLKQLTIFFTVQFDKELLMAALNAVCRLPHTVRIDFVEYVASAPLRCYRYTQHDFHMYSMLSDSFKQNVLSLSQPNIYVHPYDFSYEW